MPACGRRTRRTRESATPHVPASGGKMAKPRMARSARIRGTESRCGANAGTARCHRGRHGQQDYRLSKSEPERRSGSSSAFGPESNWPLSGQRFIRTQDGQKDGILSTRSQTRLIRLGRLGVALRAVSRRDVAPSFQPTVHVARRIGGEPVMKRIVGVGLGLLRLVRDWMGVGGFGRTGSRSAPLKSPSFGKACSKATRRSSPPDWDLQCEPSEKRAAISKRLEAR